MARAAIPGRLTWQPATVAATRAETATARTLVLDVDGWTGHVPGQHLDIRLTAPDGYMAHRSYSISSAPGPDRLEVTGPGSDRRRGLRDADVVAFVCGPTGFVETVADLLVGSGHNPANIRTERFGATGG
ncbi:hypothetical protein KBX71_07335 [Micromonospora sp. D93]|uniref:hypothetical protein n=1 Tax=Micromonospora sp. D93 TaxID=2824886 RepID=UPI001B381B19|nr:hypothetical protein [Micromonospora sp. D93]MBQ1017681.1 hypothetical protein [Micromonospora sp. D93]